MCFEYLECFLETINPLKTNSLDTLKKNQQLFPKRFPGINNKKSGTVIGRWRESLYVAGAYSAFVTQEFKQAGYASVLVEAMKQIVVEKIEGLYYGAAFAGTGMRIRLFLDGDTGEKFFGILDQDLVFL